MCFPSCSLLKKIASVYSSANLNSQFCKAVFILNFNFNISLHLRRCGNRQHKLLNNTNFFGKHTQLNLNKLGCIPHSCANLERGDRWYGPSPTSHKNFFN